MFSVFLDLVESYNFLAVVLDKFAIARLCSFMFLLLKSSDISSLIEGV